MSPGLWFAFILASLFVIAAPGPSVTLQVAISLRQGKMAGMALTPGIMLGNLVAMILSFAGIGAILLTYPAVFNIVKIIGAIYLVYLGIQMWKKGEFLVAPENLSASSEENYAFQAFLVTVLNPKSFFFFIAFMPQFIKTKEAFVPQILFLGATFLVIVLLTGVSYSAIAGKASVYLNKTAQKWIFRAGAINLFLSGISVFVFK